MCGLISVFDENLFDELLSFGFFPIFWILRVVFPSPAPGCPAPDSSNPRKKIISLNILYNPSAL
ncbi:MAG: hypothetical protein HC912_11245 [Saprospiraceae bacterium]|nr:hypothetical protein [Saprospiraceae bacterium]